MKWNYEAKMSGVNHLRPGRPPQEASVLREELEGGAFFGERQKDSGDVHLGGERRWRHEEERDEERRRRLQRRHLEVRVPPLRRVRLRAKFTACNWNQSLFMKHYWEIRSSSTELHCYRSTATVLRITVVGFTSWRKRAKKEFNLSRLFIFACSQTNGSKLSCRNLTCSSLKQKFLKQPLKGL